MKLSSSSILSACAAMICLTTTTTAVDAATTSEEKKHIRGADSGAGANARADKTTGRDLIFSNLVEEEVVGRSAGTYPGVGLFFHPMYYGAKGGKGGKGSKGSYYYYGDDYYSDDYYGSKGSKGSKGYNDDYYGSKGSKGSKGCKGSKGTKGSKGSKGSKGCNTHAPTFIGTTFAPTSDISCRPTPAPSVSQAPTLPPITSAPVPLGPPDTPAPSLSMSPSFTPTFPPTTHEPSLSVEPSNMPIAAASDPPSNPPTTGEPSPGPTPAPSTTPTCEHKTPSPTPDLGRRPTTSPTNENTCVPGGAMSIYEYLCSERNFNLICHAVTAAGLKGLLDGTDGSVITFFAPTNPGMLNAALNKDRITELGAEFMAKIIKSHALAGTVTAESLICNTQSATLLGIDSTTQCLAHSHGKSQVGEFNTHDNYPVILIPTDIEFCNGYVQCVNNVIQLVDISEQEPSTGH